MDALKSNNMDVKIIKSNRKTISIQLNQDLTITVRAPRRATLKDIDAVLVKNEAWINKQVEKMKIRRANEEANPIVPLSEAEIRKLADKALEVIPERVKYYASLIGVDYGRITIRHQKTRWGSCSSKGNLNFNCLLMLAPSEVIDYVVVHELCHRKEMNHSKAFWNEVAKILPNYKESKKWLNEEGNKLIVR